jgi:crotonobetaine/carnitine-CoA ligase
LAHRLTQRGVRYGDAFALLMHNRPEFVEAMIAASILGAVFMPIDPRTDADRLLFMLQHTACCGALIGEEAGSAINLLKAERPHLWTITISDDLPEDPPSLPCKDIEIASHDPDATMQFLFTSGTTGHPKAIVSPHRRFGTGAALLPAFGFRSDDRPYTGLSLTHANAQLLTVGAALHLGLRAVISRKFSRSRLWPIVREHGCTIFNLLGGMSVEVFSAAPSPNDRDHKVRRVISAGMPVAIWRAFETRFGLEVLEFYGAAEGGLTINRPDEGPVGSVGKPPPIMELAILDDAGARLPAGEAGEIAFRSLLPAPLQAAYHADPQASAAKVRDGWLFMGDTGHVDENGWLYFHHRKGGAIRRNGEFIDAGAVESAIAAHPDVHDVCVYGVPAANGAPGESDIVAAIVTDRDAHNEISAIFAFTATRLKPNAQPRYMQRVEAIPKTASQKPLTRLLQETFAPDAMNVFSRPLESNAKNVEETA